MYRKLLISCMSAFLFSLGLWFAAAQFGVSSSAYAQEWPSRPLTMIVPARAGGGNDRAARLMSRFLSKELGQPIKVINKPGGGNLLGHLHFLKQKDDGYTLLRTTTMPFLALNTILQGAKFKVSDFDPINLPEQGFSLVATSKGSPYKTIYDVIDAIRANPGKVSVGLEPTDAAMFNFRTLLTGLGLSIDNVRVVTYDSGGPLRTGIIGGQFDIGVTGTQGSEHLISEWRPLLVFAPQKIEPWNGWGVPIIGDVAKKIGFKFDRVLGGSLQGYLVHATLKNKHPDRYKKLVEIFKKISTDPKAIEAHKGAKLAISWVGPAKSKKIMMGQYEILLDPKVHNVFRPK